MRRQSFYISVFVLTCSLVMMHPGKTFSQQEKQVRAAFQEYSGMMVEEKLFAHTDRELYLPGETIWMKIYYVDGKRHQPFNMSKVVYVELINKDQHPAARTTMEMEKGGAEGYLQLPVSIGSGEYILRAYTSWMKNFDPAFYFNRKISIVDPGSKTSPFVEKEESSISPFVEKERSGISPLVEKERIGISPLDEKENQVMAELFPEGGQLVEGFKSRVAFSVVDQQGKGRDAMGVVVNSRGDTLTKFRTLKFGMGVFEINPQRGEKYEVRINTALSDSAGPTDTGIDPVDPTMPNIVLPLEVSNSGYALRLDEKEMGKLRLTTHSGTEPMLVVIHSRQKISHAFLVPPAEDERYLDISKSELGEGVSHITVFNSRNEPVAERLYCKLPDQQLNIRLSSSRDILKPREKFRLGIDVINQEGGTGNNHSKSAGSMDLSVSVFQVDPAQPVNIEGLQEYLFLRAELGGYIEEPSYYFERERPDRLQLLDNLMMTQGWRKFSWKNILSPAVYSPANLPEIEGRILKATNEGEIPNATGMISFPGKSHALTAASPDSSGAIYFNIPVIYGRRLLVGELYKDGNIHPGFRLESPYSEEYTSFPLSATVEQTSRLAESAFINHQVSAGFMNDQGNDFSLTDSTVTSGRIVDATPNSALLNTGQSKIIGDQAVDTAGLFFGKADRTYILDDYTRFESMEDVLREYVMEVLVQKRRDVYRFNLVKRNEDGTSRILNPAIFLDGVPVNEKIILDLDPLKIRKLDIVRSRYFFGPSVFDGILSFSTYEGKTAAIELDPGMLIIDFEGLQSRRQFVAPAYPTETERLSRIPDFRSTLYWNPSLKTKKNNAELKFFTADNRGKFIVLVHGLDENGLAGSAWYSFEVK